MRRPVFELEGQVGWVKTGRISRFTVSFRSAQQSRCLSTLCLLRRSPAYKRAPLEPNDQLFS